MIADITYAGVEALAFEPSEYERRQAAVDAEMERLGLDGLLLFHQESLYYLYGYDQIGYWVYQAFVVPRGGRPIAIGRRADECMIRASPWVEDMRVWMDDSDVDPGDLTLSVLTELGLVGSGKRVGIEKKAHSLLPYFYDLVRDRIGDSLELVDASDLVTELRIRKSPAEAAYVREAGLIMDAGLEHGLASIRDGVRESDVHAAVCDAMYRMGGELPAVSPPIASGPRTLTQTHGGATRRRISHGDAVTIEVGGVSRRYHAVSLRSAYVGTPPAGIQRLHDSLAQALDVGLESIRPGMPTAELARTTLGQLHSDGYDRRGRHVGYGTGIGYPPTWLDNLRIKESDAHRLEPGTVFFFFLGAFSEGGEVYLGVGDPVLITDSGAEVLSSVERRLFAA